MCDTLQVHLIPGSSGLDLTTIVSLVIGVAGLLFGIYQYFIGRRGKRIEYLDGLVKRLREEPLLKSATLLLDWETRDIKIGERTVDFDVRMLPHALADHNTFENSMIEGFNDDEVAIRDAFDAFFDFCSSVQYVVELGMVNHDDIFSSPLAYYLNKILEKDGMTGEALTKYIRAYSFHKTNKLLEAYKERIGKIAKRIRI